MSDKVWNRDTFDLLLADGTEFLGVVVNYSDRISWAKYAAERKETGATDWRVDTAGTLWMALQRTGRISGDYAWPRFRTEIADWEKTAADPVDPTQPGPGNDSPVS